MKLKEYHIKATFSDMPERTYKRRLYHSLEEAEADLINAIEYYSGAFYQKHNPQIFIESREVTQWKKV